MIKTNELRIGNWVQNGFGDPIKITDNISKHNTSGYNTETLKPIELTAEILEAATFENDDDDWLIDIDDRTSIHINLLKSRTLLESYDGVLKINNVSFLHQLQNLYFALTGQELEINL